MKTYNITKNLNTNAGRNKYSIPIGTTRNIRGSANRIYQYCRQNSDDPFYCMFGIVKPSPPRPIKNCLNGFLSYFFKYIGSDPITQYIVEQNLPVYTIAGILNVVPEVTIEGNMVYVEITTCLYELPTYPDNVGISIGTNTDIVNYINANTEGVTFIASSNCPFAKFGSQFKGINNLTISQAKGFRQLNYFTPYFLPGTSLLGCFQNCINFNSNISGWDTTNVTDMAGMFYGATSFDQPIGNWNTSNVLNIESMFYSASSFNQSLENWDTSNVTNMAFTFREATNFDQPLNLWDTSKVTTMSNMFREASLFNQPLNDWNTSNVTNMASMFREASLFNQPLNDWNTSNVTTMTTMFYLATSFNQNIDSWNTSNVTTMSNMFYSASSFNNGEITNTGNNPLNWSAPLCTTFVSMFHLASKFNQPLPNLVNTSELSDGCSLASMFQLASAFNQNINSWKTLNVTNMASMFYLATSFDQPLNDWKTSNVTNMSNMFRETNFNRNIGLWNVSKVETMANMFYISQLFNNEGSSDIQDWSAPLCTSFKYMFSGASLFNQPLTNLYKDTIANSCDMNLMFYLAISFNQNIDSWDVSKVTNMGSMFQSASAFNNGEITNTGSNPLNWSAPLCTTFVSMFYLASKFNQPLPNLVNTSELSDICSMNQMFRSASAFNQNIGSWDVLKVTNMGSMFQSASAFNNGEITNTGSNPLNWSAPLCTTFVSMFYLASNFNQPLTNLVNTSGVVSCSLASMFQNALNFNQNLNTWNTENVTTMASMFLGSSSAGINMKFNNGEIGFQSIPNITPSNSSYVNLTRTLSCPGATFLSTLAIGDCLIIQTSSIVYSTSIQNITNDSTLVVSASYPYGANISSSNITSIVKQVSGTSPLTFNTSNVTSLSSMFRYCRFFNQNLTTSGNTWNTNKVNTSSDCFGGTLTSGITLFNNGQVITGTTAPMGWTFAPSAILTNFRLNCRLTNENKPASV